MAYISLDDAAARSGIPPRTLQALSEKGLITIHERPCSTSQRPELSNLITVEQFVDDEELNRVVESLGWLKISGQGWEGKSSNSCPLPSPFPHYFSENEK